MKPDLLDLFGCEGIGAWGYARAGFAVTGVDLDKNRLKHYPFEHHLADAIEFVKEHGHEFDAIHASPPCQGYSRGNAGKETDWPLLISEVREALEATGKPYVIENVRDAAWDMRNPVLLCGCMFDLSVLDFTCTSPGQHAGTCDTENGVTVHLERGRLFETNWGMTAPRPCEGEGQPRNNHPSHEWVAGAYGGARRDKYEARYIRKGGYVPPSKELVEELLGVEHKVTWQGLKECIPPAYTEWIGRQLIAGCS